MPPKKNRLAQSSAAPVTEQVIEAKRNFKRNMQELCPVIECYMEDIQEYQDIVKALPLDSDQLKNEIALQKSVVSKIEQALDALQEAAALTRLADGDNDDGARKKKKASE